jgi:glycosyltransferase involved in cell wall biosynthesis
MLTDLLRQRGPVLCFVGPMVGRIPGFITTQGGILSDLFAAAGYSIISVSDSPNRWVRLGEIVTTLIRRRRGVDCVILEVYGRRSFVVEDIASRLASHAGLPLIMVVHSGSFPKFIARFPRWTRRTLGRADALVTPSPFLARAVAQQGFTARVIPNVIDMSLLPYRRRRHVMPRLLWMRSFYSYYNPTMALQVLANLRSTTPDATLVMAGRDKGIEHQVQRVARDLGVSDAVRFPGFLDGAGKMREGNLADIFINTNQVDNMPVSVLEACAMGLPVVATDVGGIRDVLTDGETALLVPDGDARAMADAIRRLQREPTLADRLSVNGRELAARSAWESVRPQWEHLLREVIANRDRPSTD